MSIKKADLLRHVADVLDANFQDEEVSTIWFMRSQPDVYLSFEAFQRMFSGRQVTIESRGEERTYRCAQDGITFVAVSKPVVPSVQQVTL